MPISRQARLQVIITYTNEFHFDLLLLQRSTLQRFGLQCVQAGQPTRFCKRHLLPWADSVSRSLVDPLSHFAAAQDRVVTLCIDDGCMALCAQHGVQCVRYGGVALGRSEAADRSPR